jgi:disulfide bond formation protein DsbB
MQNKLSPRVILALIGFICIAVLAMAWYLQYGPGKQQPCPLCILQRYAYMALASVCLLAALHGPRRIGMLAYAIVADAISAVGLALAIWQVNKGASMNSCLSDPVGEFVNGLPSANWWPEYLFANGGCADVFPPILGLHAPQWSMVWFAVFRAMIGVALFSIVRQMRRT